MVSSRSSMTIGGSRTITVSLNNSMAIVFAAEIKGERKGEIIKNIVSMTYYAITHYAIIFS